MSASNLCSEWRDFYSKRVSSWMSLEELRAECGKLQTVDATSPELLLIHAMHALEECVQRDEAMRAEVDEWKRVAAAQAELHGEAEERADQLAEDDAWCADAWCAECGVKLENVRPGKHQHPTCSQAALQWPAAVAQPLTDEALLRQALEELEELKAENERLRAEVERFRTDGASAVRWAPGSAYWSGVLVELFGPDARKGIDVLEARWRKEIERAEQLEEALRVWWEAHRPVGWTEDQHRSCPHVNLATHAEKALADALLRAQEEDND